MLFSRGLASSMSKNRDTAVVTVGFGQGSKVDSVPMGSRITHIPEALTGQRGPGNPQSSGPRHGRLMHQSTLSLGDPQGSGTSYTTTHTQVRTVPLDGIIELYHDHTHSGLYH
jgi:hypothetical protein